MHLWCNPSKNVHDWCQGTLFQKIHIKFICGGQQTRDLFWHHVPSHEHGDTKHGDNDGEHEQLPRYCSHYNGYWQQNLEILVFFTSLRNGPNVLLREWIILFHPPYVIKLSNIGSEAIKPRVIEFLGQLYYRVCRGSFFSRIDVVLVLKFFIFCFLP